MKYQYKLKNRKKSVWTICIIETNNNIFVNFSHYTKGLVCQYSGGSVGMLGPKRKTPLSGELIGKKIALEASDRGIRRMDITVKGTFSGVVRGVLRGLSSKKLLFGRMAEIKGISHNGVRQRKQRRL